MKLSRKIIISIFTCLIISSSFGQNILYPGRPKIFHFNLEDYNAVPQTWGFIQDARGYLYIANTGGVVIFDGQNWEVLKPPYISLVKSFTKDENNKIYVSGYNNIFYLSVDSVGDFFLETLEMKNKYNFGYVHKLLYSDKNLVFKADSGLFIYDLIDEKLYQLTNKPGFFIDKAHHDILAYHKNKVYRIDLINKRLELSPLNNTLSDNNIILGIFQAFKDKIIVIRNNYIFLLNKKYKIIKKIRTPYHTVLASYIANDNYAFLNFLDKGLLIYDKNLNLINIFDKNTGLSVNTFYGMYIDTYNNLWLAENTGIDCIILNSPLSYLDKNYGFGVSNGTAHFNNNFYFLFSFKIKYIPDSILLNPYKTKKYPIEINKYLGQNWNFYKLKKALLISHNPGIIRVSQNGIKLIDSIKEAVWRIEKIPGSNLLFLGTRKGGYVVQYTHNGKLYNFRKIVNGNIRHFIIDKHQNFWGIISYASVSFVKAKILTGKEPGFQIIKNFSEKDGITPLLYTTIFYDKFDDKIIVNNADTIKYFDTVKQKFVKLREITKHFNEEDKNQYIYFLYIDDLGNYWINYVNKSLPLSQRYKIFLFKKENNKLKFLPLLTQSVAFGDYYITGFTYNKRFVFFNTSKGVLIFDYQHPIDTSKYHFNIFLRKIVSTKDNKIIWAGNSLGKNQELTSRPPLKLKLKYKENSIKFYIAAPFYENSEDILFSYKLDGIDKQWTPWTSLNEKEYTFLREGKYTLRVKAKNIYGIYSPELSYTFWIRPPWYRSITAYLIYVSSFVILIFISSRLYTRSLRNRAKRLENIIKHRTETIEQQKEELKKQTEELVKINKELEQLSIIAEKTDNAIILTDEKGNFIWINRAFTKIFGYNLNELITEVGPNIIGKETPEDIKKAINKVFSEKEPVEYEAKYKTKDNNFVWVHVTVTPILDHKGEITNFIIVDSDITQLKTAEEKIKGSIRYSKIIQTNILPKKKDLDKHFDSFIIYYPRDIVSGDFYWISKTFHQDNQQYSCIFDYPFFKAGDYIFIALMDCTGHGVPGAFMSMIGNRLLDNIINKNNIHDPAGVFTLMDKELNEMFKETEIIFHEGMAGSLCRFDKICMDSKPMVKLTIANAKTDMFIYYKDKNELIHIKGVKRYLNQYLPITVNFKNDVFYLQEGDTVFLFTDGLKDQNNVERKKFGIKRFKKFIMENINLSMDELGRKIDKTLKDWMTGTDQRDDITVIGLKIKF